MSKEQEEVRNAFIEIQNAMIKKDFDTLNKMVKDDMLYLSKLINTRFIYFIKNWYKVLL